MVKQIDRTVVGTVTVSTVRVGRGRYETALVLTVGLSRIATDPRKSSDVRTARHYHDAAIDFARGEASPGINSASDAFWTSAGASELALIKVAS